MIVNDLRLSVQYRLLLRLSVSIDRHSRYACVCRLWMWVFWCTKIEQSNATFSNCFFLRSFVRFVLFVTLSTVIVIRQKCFVRIVRTSRSRDVEMKMKESSFGFSTSHVSVKRDEMRGKREETKKKKKHYYCLINVKYVEYIADTHHSIIWFDQWKKNMIYEETVIHLRPFDPISVFFFFFSNQMHNENGTHSKRAKNKKWCRIIVRIVVVT